MLIPSRQFKENFVIGGCFVISIMFLVGLLLLIQLWWLLPVFVIAWLFMVFQSIRMGIWKRKNSHDKPE